MNTGNAMRLHTMLRRFQLALDFATQVHDTDGNSPLHQVVKQECRGVDCSYLIQLLLSHGFSANSRNREGKEARDYLQEGSLAHRLLAWQSESKSDLLYTSSVAEMTVLNCYSRFLAPHRV